jgi:hypothetical protein
VPSTECFAQGEPALQSVRNGDNCGSRDRRPPGREQSRSFRVALHAIATAAAPSDPDRRRLVLGAAIGFDAAQVRVFVESLRAHYAGDVLLLIRWPGLRVARYLKNRGVDAIRVFQTRSFTRSVHARRYVVYLDYLRAARLLRSGHDVRRAERRVPT